VTDYETVEELTEIMARQAILIQRLYGIVKQLNATTSLDDEVVALLEETNNKEFL